MWPSLTHSPGLLYTDILATCLSVYVSISICVSELRAREKNRTVARGVLSVCLSAFKPLSLSVETTLQRDSLSFLLLVLVMMERMNRLVRGKESGSFVYVFFLTSLSSCLYAALETSIGRFSRFYLSR